MSGVPSAGVAARRVVAAVLLMASSVMAVVGASGGVPEERVGFGAVSVSPGVVFGAADVGVWAPGVVSVVRSSAVECTVSWVPAVGVPVAPGELVFDVHDGRSPGGGVVVSGVVGSSVVVGVPVGDPGFVPAVSARVGTWASQPVVAGDECGGVPGAVREVVVSPVSGGLVVSWGAPVWDGGSPVTGVVATVQPGGGSCVFTPTSTAAGGCTVTGLVGGQGYAVSVVASNAWGAGPPVTAGATAGATVPGAPTGVSAVGGNGQVVVSWSPPAADGGSPVAEYTATAAPGGSSCTVAGSPPAGSCAVTGLANGSEYTVTVTATNGVGTGPPSAPVGPVAPSDGGVQGGLYWAGEAGVGDVHVLQPTEVAGGGAWLDVDVGRYHGCGIRTDEALWCWGANWEGQLGLSDTTYRASPVRVGTATWRSVAVGMEHSCGVQSDGSLWCWGANWEGQLTGSGNRSAPTRVGIGTTWVAVDLGDEHSCAVQADGSAWCWGGNWEGQVGDGTTSGPRRDPTLVTGGHTWTDVSVGAYGACGITGTGSLWCWGNDGATLSGTPQQLGTSTDWVSVAVGEEFGCGIQVDTSLWCWGANGNGQVGVASPTQVGAPTAIGGTGWVGVTAGEDHACGVRVDDSARCWGGNTDAQLGADPAVSPGGHAGVDVPGSQWSRVVAGATGSCGIREGDSLWCWGRTTFGQTGTGLFAYAVSPQQKGTAITWRTVASSWDVSCGIRGDGSLWCWGDPALTGFSPPLTPEPVQVGTGTWTDVTVGGHFACALRADRTLWCWGGNAAGQLGQGDRTNRASPTQVGTAADWTDVDAGWMSVCGVRDGAGLWCWGSNFFGQLGLGASTADVLAPAQVGVATDWTSIRAGQGHTCGIRAGGQLWCWGHNNVGYLGVGDTAQRRTPTRVGHDTDWTAVAADYQHTCGLRGAGTLWCWGRNMEGQLGLGDGADRWVPTQVGASSDWTAVDTSSHTCGIRAGATLWCWGHNGAGELGQGYMSPFEDQPTAVPALSPAQRVTTGTGRTLVIR